MSDPAGHIPRLDAWRAMRRRRRATRPRVRKLRLLLILAGLGALALVSTVFGMMMAVASDLPKLENKRVFRLADKRNSVLVDIRGRPLGLLTSNQNAVLVRYGDIAPVMRQAIIAIEDKRFYENQGFDVRGIGRAFVQDVIHKQAKQGGSTITQQFVKNQLKAQSNRTIFQKLREAAMAYHLTRKWSKEKILTEYLNSIYMGHGAWGIESAARVYFGAAHPHCGEQGHRYCADLLNPVEAASLAGMVASPSGYDPVLNATRFKRRRNLVLQHMWEQGVISRAEYENGIDEVTPSQEDLTPPAEHSEAPYFTSWVRQLVVDRLGTEKAFYGHYKVVTSLDLRLQKAAEEAASHWLGSPGQPSASVVAIDNKSGEVRAMVGGRDYASEPFNLATQGQRQPGSSFKPFTLAVALKKGISPGSLWASRKKIFTVPHTHGKEKFVVNNYEGSYSGANTLAGALTVSDNSIFAEVGIKVGTARIARMARAMGIRTPVSTNPAITLGGLKQGVTPLDMAHAYETFATGGERIYNPELGADDEGPVGIHKVVSSDGKTVVRENARPDRRRVLSKQTAATATSMLESVVSSGTGKQAAFGGFAAGKTGTTENYGDAWFVGWSDKLTVAVWVGYPHGVKPMKTEFQGAPVAGGTFPALIWHEFMLAAQGIEQQDHPAKPPATVTPTYAPVTPAPTTTAPQSSTPTTTTPPAATTPTTPPAATTGQQDTTPQTQSPAPQIPAPQTPVPQTPAPPAPAGPPDGTGTGTGAAVPPGTGPG